MENERIVAEIKKSPQNKKDLLAELFFKNKPLIEKQCRSFSFVVTSSSLDHDDLMQISFLGLCYACDTFDPSRGVPFINYLLRCCRWYILRELHEHGTAIQLPRRLRGKFSQYKRYRSEFYMDNGEYPSRWLCAAVCECSEKDIELLENFHAVLSLDAPVANSEDVDLTLSDTIQDAGCLEDAVIERVFDNQLQIDLWDETKKICSDREYDILRLYFNGRSISDIACDYGLEKSRVSSIVRAAYQKLRRSRKLQRIAYLTERATISYHGTLGAFNHSGWSTVESATAWRLELDTTLDRAFARHG